MFFKMRHSLFAILITAFAVSLSFAAVHALTDNSVARMKVSVELPPRITLESIVVESDRSFVLRGRADDHIGACLPTWTFVDGERESWWPVSRCVVVDEAGQWSIRIPSDDGGRPVSIHFVLDG